MNKLILLFLALIVVACNNNKYKILGELPDQSYDGEWIYLVPLVNAPVERVDSTVIRNGGFTFKGNVDSTEIYIIRGRPFLRLSLQELLVVKEPGVIQAKLNHYSSTKGTALNDSLEYWKEEKHHTDTLLVNFRTQFRATTDTIQQAIIKQKVDSLNKEITSFNYNFIANNRTNVVGEMVYRFKKGTFTKEQLESLGLDK